jgi:hypothetical protein
VIAVRVDGCIGWVKTGEEPSGEKPPPLVLHCEITTYQFGNEMVPKSEILLGDSLS